MFWERLTGLCDEMKIKPNNVAKAIGASTAIATKWKNGTVPNGETLVLIADYFDCSIDYLMGRTDCKSMMIEEKSNYIRIYDSAVSAGTGLYIDYDSYETVETDDDVQSGDFAVRVSGDSMTPRFCDGDIVLVESAPRVEIGEIGIFIVDSQAYIKQLGNNCLISLNSKYPPIDISKTESVYCQGKVIKVLNIRKGV